MASYKIEWKNSAYKELQKLPHPIIPRIVAAVSDLANNPFPLLVSRRLQVRYSSAKNAVQRLAQRGILSPLGETNY